MSEGRGRREPSLSSVEGPGHKGRGTTRLDSLGWPGGRKGERSS